jgi:hypothetical protein
MRPVKVKESDVCYRGPTPDIGDLWCERVALGQIKVVYGLSDAERAVLAANGRVELILWSEPIPPISMNVLTAEEAVPVGPHGWKGGAV